MLLTDKQQLFDSPRLSQLVDIASKNAGGIQDITDTTVTTWTNTVRQLTQHVGNIRVDALTPQMLKRFQTAVSFRASNQTANAYIRFLKTMYNRILSRGIVAHNPAAYIPALPEPPNFPRAITEETYEALRTAATNSRNLAIIDLLYISGCRIGELTTMKLDAVERFPNGGREGLAIEVLGKGGKFRNVYAKGLQAQSVIRYIDHKRPFSRYNRLFVTRAGEPLMIGSIHSVIRNTRTRASLPKGTISNAHSFRHAAAIRWLDEGIDLATVSAWLGHSDPAFTAKVYCIRTESQLRAKFFK